MKTQQLIGKVISVALAAILVIGGGTTVFAAETIGCDDPKTVELDGYNTKVNYTFRPETDGDYQFTSSDISDEDLKPAISIYRSGKLAGEAGGDGSNYSLTLYDLEAGKAYQIQAVGTGLHMGTEATYTLTITNVTPVIDTQEEIAPDFGGMDINYLPETSSDIIPTVIDDTIDNPINNTPAAVTPITDNAPATSAAPAATPAITTINVDPNASVKNFVERLYLNVLGREFDIAGRDYWVDMLLGQGYSGSKVANGFFMSSEFASMNLSDEEYISTLYMVFFGRTPDVAGMQNWLNALENGATRSEVLEGFTASAEWGRTCAFYGINV